MTTTTTATNSNQQHPLGFRGEVTAKQCSYLISLSVLAGPCHTPITCLVYIDNDTWLCQFQSVSFFFFPTLIRTYLRLQQSLHITPLDISSSLSYSIGLLSWVWFWLKNNSSWIIQIFSGSSSNLLLKLYNLFHNIKSCLLNTGWPGQHVVLSYKIRDSCNTENRKIHC